MKKLFISQPMRGKSDEDILKERAEAIKNAKEIIKDDVAVLDSFFDDFNGNALGFLAKSIALLSEADVAYFVPGWKDARGCRIEHTCAVEYGIAVIDPDEKA